MYFSLGEKREQTYPAYIPFTNRCCVPSMDEIGPMVQDRKIKL